MSGPALRRLQILGQEESAAATAAGELSRGQRHHGCKSIFFRGDSGIMGVNQFGAAECSTPPVLSLMQLYMDRYIMIYLRDTPSISDYWAIVYFRQILTINFSQENIRCLT
jgi:hypothetical protein